MQVAVIDFARDVLGMADANSVEFEAATEHPAVVFMPEGSTTHKGGTMRLGSRRTMFETMDCVAAKLYQVTHPVSAVSYPACLISRMVYWLLIIITSNSLALGISSLPACLVLL